MPWLITSKYAWRSTCRSGAGGSGGLLVSRRCGGGGLGGVVARGPAATTAAGLLAHLDLQEPELAVLVGGRSVAPETLLRSGDEVAILRHAEGG